MDVHELEVALVQHERPLLSDAVVQQLTQHIVSRALMPGDQLPSEAEIARKFGVSKPVVREAVRKLAALGIVDIRQGKASTVGSLAPEPVRQLLRFALHINPQGLRDAVDLRRALETHAAVLAARNVDDDGIARLRGVLARLRSSVAEHDAWVEADVEFHQLIAHLSGNSLIAFMLAALSDTMREIISTLHAARPTRDSGTLKRHAAIVDAISKRDESASAAAMEAHFAATVPVIADLLKKRAR